MLSKNVEIFCHEPDRKFVRIISAPRSNILVLDLLDKSVDFRKGNVVKCRITKFSNPIEPIV